MHTPSAGLNLPFQKILAKKLKKGASLIDSDYYVSGIQPGSVGGSLEYLLPFFIPPKDIPEEYY